jgi:hypothetical protein
MGEKKIRFRKDNSEIGNFLVSCMYSRSNQFLCPLCYVVPVTQEEQPKLRETRVGNFSDAQDKLFTKGKPTFASMLVHVEIQYRQPLSHLWKTQLSSVTPLLG